MRVPLSVCVCVCACVPACVRACVCVCVCVPRVSMRRLRTVSMDKILRFTNTLIIIHCFSVSILEDGVTLSK